MAWWARLDPAARRAVMIGVPIVGIAALASTLRPRAAAEVVDGAQEAATGIATTPVAPAVGGWVLGGQGDAVGVGELGSMFTGLSNVVGGLTDTVLALPQAVVDQIQTDRPSDPTPPAADPYKGVHVTTAGDTWATVARRHYGSSGYAGPLARDPRNAAIARVHTGLQTALPGGLTLHLPVFA